MDIMELLDRDGIKLKKQSHREFSSECPWCGGRDRFRVWPNENDSKGAFWCRGCDRGGDMIKYQMLCTDQKYFDACYDLGVEPKFKRYKKNARIFDKCLPPPLAWRQHAAELINRCHDVLTSKRGANMRIYLHERGINDRSIAKALLGLNAVNRQCNRQPWGLPEELKPDTAKPKKLWIPNGLMIPCFVSGEVIRLRVRREKVNSNSRYVTVSGSSKQPMRLGRMSTVVVVESDLDAILISQDVGDLVSAVSLGSASLRPDNETHDFLKDAKIIMLALDYDDAGKQQIAWWQRQYGAKVRRWPVPVGKDPGEAYQAGMDIRAWIDKGLAERQ